MVEEGPGDSTLSRGLEPWLPRGALPHTARNTRIPLDWDIKNPPVLPSSHRCFYFSRPRIYFSRPRAFFSGKRLNFFCDREGLNCCQAQHLLLSGDWFLMSWESKLLFL